MPNARDIALIFLSIEALVAAVVPLALLAGLAYGVYWVRGKVTAGLRIAQNYARQGHVVVEKAAFAIAKPLISLYATVRMVETIINRIFQMVSRRSL